LTTGGYVETHKLKEGTSVALGCEHLKTITSVKCILLVLLHAEKQNISSYI